jgi:kynurenine formamidase
MSIPPRPPFSALPLDKNGPAGNAWGLYGADDEIGSLNLLTPSTVANAAASEIKTGERVSLDWRLDRPIHAMFERQNFKWHMYQRGGRYVNDDVVEMNTQGGSQWDGFRHYAYQKAKRYYNNRTQEQLENSSVIGLDVVVEKGGIVGRGVLLDYAAYCEAKSIQVDTMSSTGIPLSQLHEIAKEKNIEFRAGDILFIRTGFTKSYNALSTAQQKDLTVRKNAGDFIGIEPTKATVQWIWESSFAAVASDCPAFEQGPTSGPHTAIGGNWKGESWEEEMQGGGLLHQFLLAGWGCPIGEMFDLERLSEKCEKLGRWSFFVSSVPLKIPGGVGSPPNAVAIF